MLINRAILQVLHVTCPNSAIADSLAHLVEGYHMLLTQSMYSVWVQRGNSIFLSVNSSKNFRRNFEIKKLI